MPVLRSISARVSRWLFATALLIINLWQPASATPQEKLAELTFAQLLDRLIETSEPGHGYALYSSGDEFLPYEGSGHASTGIIGAMGTTPSPPLREIVRRGAAVVPELLKHLDDKRPLRAKPLAGMMWMDFPDEYDYNGRTRKTPPAGVNRDDLLRSDRKHPEEHQLTVGDLCYVALGQIVNRYFKASRYQPTGGLIINSPTYSERLRDTIIAEWKDLTPAKHRASLIDDFRRPDFEDRQQDAYLRLAFYYPDAVEPLVLAELDLPTYDGGVVSDFLHDTLFPSTSAALRKRHFDDFVKKHGAAAAAGVEKQLFDELRVRYDEKQADRARGFLAELFGHPANVQIADRPLTKAVGNGTRASLIETLRHDQSPKIGQRVRAIYESTGDDDYLAHACLLCLASRDFGPFLIEQLKQLDWQPKETNRLHLRLVQAIVKSPDPAVRGQLRQFAEQTTNADYFLTIVPILGKEHDDLVLKLAREHIARVPVDSEDGEYLLHLVHARFPKQAREILVEFLKPNTAHRNATVCNVLWNGDPLAPELLGPMLEDRRKLSGRFREGILVSDRAADAVSHHAKDLGIPIQYDSDASPPVKAAAIERLKEFCRKQLSEAGAK